MKSTAYLGVFGVVCLKIVKEDLREEVDDRLETILREFKFVW